MDAHAPTPAASPPVVTGLAAVRAVLADPRYTVPDPGHGAPPGTMAWLRENVARFSNGADHARRRALAEGLLRGLDPGLLRDRAREECGAAIDAAGEGPWDMMALIARRVPGRVLAAALGAADPEQVTRLLPPATAAYLLGGTEQASADECVARLIRLLPGGPEEEVAARTGLLVQACEATAGLIGNAVAAGLRATVPPPAAAVVEQTLREDPPVLVTRRAGPGGELVTLDLTCAGGDPAGHLAFGYGPHACPGAAHARALAEGVAGPLLGRCRATCAQIRYPAPPAPRVPARLEVLRVG